MSIFSQFNQIRKRVAKIFQPIVERFRTQIPEKPIVEVQPPKPKTFLDSAPDSMTAFDWEKLEYASLFNKAKERMDALKSSSYLSPALLDFEEEGDYVNLASIETKEQLITEATRLQNFMNDKTSQLEGAAAYTQEYQALQKYGTAFKVENKDFRESGYNQKTGEYFTPLDYERERAAWATFRELQRHHMDLIQDHYGYGPHVTQTLIAELYDALEGEDPATFTEWYYDEDGYMASRGKVNTNAFKLLHDRLDLWKDLDLNENHLSNVIQEVNNQRSSNTGNFSHTEASDYMGGRSI